MSCPYAHDETHQYLAGLDMALPSSRVYFDGVQEHERDEKVADEVFDQAYKSAPFANAAADKAAAGYAKGEIDPMTDLYCREDFDSDLLDDCGEHTPKDVVQDALDEAAPNDPQNRFEPVDRDWLRTTQVDERKWLVRPDAESHPSIRVAHKKPRRGRKSPRVVHVEPEAGADDPNLIEYFARWPDLSAASQISISRTFANYMAACVRAGDMERHK